MANIQNNAGAKSLGSKGDHDFLDDNPELARLPLGIVTGDRERAAYIEAIERSTASLTDKIRKLDERDLIPLVLGARLKPDNFIFLKIADDISRLDICRVCRTIDAQELNSEISLKEGDFKVLATVPNPRLLFSVHDISKFSSPEVLEQVGQLYTHGRRITQYMGVNVTWDQSVDSRVWTTNIDTVNFLDALAKDGVFERADVKRSMEVGVGGSAISKVILSRLPSIEEHIATDISANALACAKRNIEPILTDKQKLSLYLGKGLKSIEAEVDLLIVNPPYIPHLQKPDAVDPYRGTGLIKEVIEQGLAHLNKSNPAAAIYLGMSSVGQKDFDEYLAQHPEIKAEEIGQRRRVPLKILDVSIDQSWIKFLKEEHGLIDSSELLRSEGFRYWHDIYVVKLTA